MLMGVGGTGEVELVGPKGPSLLGDPLRRLLDDRQIVTGHMARL